MSHGNRMAEAMLAHPAMERDIEGYRVTVHIDTPGRGVYERGGLWGRETKPPHRHGEDWQGYIDVYRHEKVDGQRVATRVLLDLHGVKRWDRRRVGLFGYEVSLTDDHHALNDRIEQAFREAVQIIEAEVASRAG